MVNEEVLKLVVQDRMNTEPLSDMFVVGPFDETLMGSNDSVFTIGTIGGHANAATGGSFVTPVDTTESYDLFKLQDEESMDTLDPSKEPPVDWEPGPEDEVDVEEIAHNKWEELHEGLGLVVADLDDLAHLLRADLHLLSDFLGRRFAPQVLQQTAADANQAVDRLHHVDGNTNRAGLVSDSTGNGLANPPGGIRAELVPLRVIELFDGTNQTNIPLLDQVQQAHTSANVLFRDTDH